MEREIDFHNRYFGWRMEIVAFVLSFIVVQSCTPFPIEKVELYELSSGGTSPLRPELRGQLRARGEELLSVAERCGESVSKGGCDTGDATLFNGILCASGDQRSCQAVASAQGNDGRFWRSPSRVGFEVENSFSRDMAMGVFLYLVTTKDRYAAVKWQIWISNNENQLCKSASDNRCTFTPGFWNLMGKIWDFIGLPQSAEMNDDFVDSLFLLPISARTSPSGYPLHLTAITLLLHRQIGVENELTTLAAAILLERQRENAFFHWLSKGSGSSVASKILEKCRPEEARLGDKSQWAFERADSSAASMNSMGWECVALINFVTGGAATEPGRIF